MLFRCNCCGFEQEFKDGEAAFEAGWDAPPHFTGYVACNICPAVCVVMGAGHEMAHAIWKRTGRPEEFTLETCATDDVIGEKDKLAGQRAGMDRFTDLLKQNPKPELKDILDLLAGLKKTGS